MICRVNKRERIHQIQRLMWMRYTYPPTLLDLTIRCCFKRADALAFVIICYLINKKSDNKHCNNIDDH